MISGFQAHAGTGIGDRDANTLSTCVPVGAGPDPDRYLAAIFYGFQRISDEVRKYLAQLSGEAQKFRCILCFQLNLDPGRAEFFLKQSQD